MRYVIWAFVALLIILHQDNWNWNNPDLVFGFLPIGLAWHAGISIMASIVWFMATLFAWPNDVDYDDEQNTKEVSA